MKIIINIILTLILTPTLLYSQLNVSMKVIGGSSHDHIYHTEIDQFDNVYSIGRYKGILDFDESEKNKELNSGVNGAIFLKKTDAKGNLLWVKNIVTILDDENKYYYGMLYISVSTNGLINIAGNYIGTIKLANSTNIFASKEVANSFVLQLNKDGGFNWVTEIEKQNFNIANDLVTLKDGSSIITGSFKNVVDKKKTGAFVLKISKVGKIEWYKTINNGIVSPSKIKKTLNNSLLIAGTYKGNPNFSLNKDVNKGLGLQFAEKGFLLEINNNGDFININGIGSGKDNLSILSMDIDKTGNVYLACQFWGELLLKNYKGNLIYESKGMTDISIIKLNSKNEVLWVNTMGNDQQDYVTDICLDKSQNNIYVSGSFKGKVNFGKETLESKTTGKYDNDGFVQKLNVDGKNSWNCIISYKKGSNPLTLAVNSQDRLYVSGYLEGGGTGVLTLNNKQITTDLISSSDGFVLEIFEGEIPNSNTTVKPPPAKTLKSRTPASNAPKSNRFKSKKLK